MACRDCIPLCQSFPGGPKSPLCMLVWPNAPDNVWSEGCQRSIIRLKMPAPRTSGMVNTGRLDEPSTTIMRKGVERELNRFDMEKKPAVVTWHKDEQKVGKVMSKVEKSEPVEAVERGVKKAEKDADKVAAMSRQEWVKAEKSKPVVQVKRDVEKAKVYTEEEWKRLKNSDVAKEAEEDVKEAEVYTRKEWEKLENSNAGKRVRRDVKEAEVYTEKEWEKLKESKIGQEAEKDLGRARKYTREEWKRLKDSDVGRRARADLSRVEAYTEDEWRRLEESRVVRGIESEAHRIEQYLGDWDGRNRALADKLFGAM